MTQSRNKKPTGTNLKRQLTQLDRTALLGLIQDIYAASSANQAFLIARFALGGDSLKPYKATISRWVCPNVLRNPGCLRFQSQEGDFRLQEGCRAI